MIPKISVCCFIRDNDSGAFALWESMATLIPFADEYLVMDFGSTDGTLETLHLLAKRNPKIKVVQRTIHAEEKTNAIFATMANEVIYQCKNDLVLYHQADEIWHEDLAGLMREELQRLAQVQKFSQEDYVNWRGLNFWRYQLRHNFQRMSWWPHPVNRLDFKHRFQFVGDGMNSNRPGDPVFVGSYDGGWGQKWQEKFTSAPYTLPTQHMILDVGMLGGFLDTIPERRRKHAPFWGESAEVIYIDGRPVNLTEWHAQELRNPEWERWESPFKIPAIMRGLLGETVYKPRQGVLRQIAEG